jgi:hypothetical protein
MCLLHAAAMHHALPRAVFVDHFGVGQLAVLTRVDSVLGLGHAESKLPLNS